MSFAEFFSERTLTRADDVGNQVLANLKRRVNMFLESPGETYGHRIVNTLIEIFNSFSTASFIDCVLRADDFDEEQVEVIVSFCESVADDDAKVMILEALENDRLPEPHEMANDIVNRLREKRFISSEETHGFE